MEDGTDTLAQRPLLLHALDALVRSDPGLPGFRGVLAIGVRTPFGPKWWAVDCAAKAEATFRDEVPREADAALLLSESGAASILESGDPGSEASLFGDSKLLQRFIARYLKKQSFVAIRVSQGNEGSSKPSARRKGR